TVQAAVFEVTHLFRVATRQHLGHQVIIVGRLVARMGACKPVPVLSTDLLEDVPVPRGCCKHEGAPSCRGQCAVQRFYHFSSAPSTPYRSAPGHPQPPPSSLHDSELRDPKNEISYTIQIELARPWMPRGRTTFGPGTVLASFAEESRTAFRQSRGRLSIILTPPEPFLPLDPGA